MKHKHLTYDDRLIIQQELRPTLLKVYRIANLQQEPIHQ